MKKKVDLSKFESQDVKEYKVWIIDHHTTYNKTLCMYLPSAQHQWWPEDYMHESSVQHFSTEKAALASADREFRDHLKQRIRSLQAARKNPLLKVLIKELEKRSKKK